MKRFRCDCGHPLFFESTHCTACGADVGFDPVTAEMVTLNSSNRTGSLFDNTGDYQRCQNGVDYGVCNWLVPPSATGSLCLGCQFNRTVVDLSSARNVARWGRFEQAKKRLIYTLLSLNLPLQSRWQNEKSGLLFDFIEDQSSNPNVPLTKVNTGHLDGIITINALEADDIAREVAKDQMNESYRTLLGHLRHEIGHYYYEACMAQVPGLQEMFFSLFGDPEVDYNASLDRYYQDGPPADWSQHCISGYASAHPLEDWAECWSHYLMLTDTLETANAYDMVCDPSRQRDFASRADLWRSFSVALNELNRSLGLADAYPFVINEQVEKKLALIDRAVSDFSKTSSR